MHVSKFISFQPFWLWSDIAKTYCILNGLCGTTGNKLSWRFCQFFHIVLWHSSRVLEFWSHSRCCGLWTGELFDEILNIKMTNYLFSGSLNLIKVYINRFFRVTPVMALLVLYILTKSKKNGALSGDKSVCSTEWPKALMLYQNYNHGHIVSIVFVFWQRPTK